ncbi:NAD(P)-binding protein [Haliea sp.]|jgi:hypothetical protein|uniref:FAD-dependent oxidoreductase n=1 Tax=Haliea TaxID=475794 RepID=UPI000E892D0F|nr:NAD(P)-binding protein [Haliea sp.]HBX72465.1 hypothetical protein [Halieaceae bacterium]HCD56618.1 hypothetical protein [Halieaceae bacterium]|tara:strand:- start:2164 stop:3174 length:1011 start_codon:yes stop_codon:yes gene_type:complete
MNLYSIRPSRSRQRAIIIGAGPAGLLAAILLKRNDLQVDLVDPTPDNGWKTRPQCRHVHVWSRSTWERLTRWLPELEKHTGTLPDRASLDRALWLLGARHIDHLHATRIKASNFTAKTAAVNISGRWVDYDLLIDASGAARATAAGIARAAGAALPLDQGTAGGNCVTLPLAGITQSNEPGSFASSSRHSRYGAILHTAGRGSGSLTLQTPGDSPPPETIGAVLQILRTLDSPEMWTMCCHARLRGRATTFPARPSSRLALESVANLPACWIPLGDCLLITRPDLGQGFAQLTEHLDVLEQGLIGGLCWPEIRNRVVASAQTQWWRATWAEALGGL